MHNRIFNVSYSRLIQLQKFAFWSLHTMTFHNKDTNFSIIWIEINSQTIKYIFGRVFEISDDSKITRFFSLMNKIGRIDYKSIAHYNSHLWQLRWCYYNFWNQIRKIIITFFNVVSSSITAVILINIRNADSLS